MINRLERKLDDDDETDSQGPSIHLAKRIFYGPNFSSSSFLVLFSFFVGRVLRPSVNVFGQVERHGDDGPSNTVVAVVVVLVLTSSIDRDGKEFRIRVLWPRFVVDAVHAAQIGARDTFTLPVSVRLSSTEPHTDRSSQTIGYILPLETDRLMLVRLMLIQRPSRGAIYYRAVSGWNFLRAATSVPVAADRLSLSGLSVTTDIKISLGFHGLDIRFGPRTRPKDTGRPTVSISPSIHK